MAAKTLRSRRRRLVSVTVSLAAALAVAASAADGGSRAPTATLTVATWLAYGVGTGRIYSPSAFCDVAADGTGLTRLSDSIGALADPAWSRDGSTLAFVSHDAGAEALLRVTPARAWAPRILARGPFGSPAWSPDGKRIAVALRSGAADTIRILEVDGSGSRLLPVGSAASPTWSPDGSTIAYSEVAGFNAAGIWTIRVDGTARTKVTSDGGAPAWSPDGRLIAFVASRAGATPGLSEQEVFTVAPDGRGRRQISRLVEPGPGVDTIVGRPAWSPDGSTIAAVRTRRVRTSRGASETSELFIVDVSTGSQTKLLTLDGIGDPTWRPATTTAMSRPCFIRAESARRIVGRGYDDLIVGGDAAQSIDGRTGNDWIHAGGGHDRVTGGRGADEIWTGRGRDTLLARDGARDVVHCGEARSDVGRADRRDRLFGSCRRVTRR